MKSYQLDENFKFLFENPNYNSRPYLSVVIPPPAVDGGFVAVFKTSLDPVLDVNFGAVGTGYWEIKPDNNQHFTPTPSATDIYYRAGLRITKHNQLFTRHGQLFMPVPNLILPYTLTGDWSSDSDKFSAITDGNLRHDLSEAGANIVSYKKPGADTIRSVSDKLQEAPSITDFGAKPEAGFDNREAIQAAIDAVCSDPARAFKKAVLRIPPGHYQFSGQLFIPASTVQFLLVGESTYTSVLFRTSVDDSPAIVDESYMSTYRNFTLQQPTNDLNNENNIGVLVKRPIGSPADLDVAFRNVRITRFNVGIETWGRGVLVQDCIISLVRWAVSLNWPNLGDYEEGSEPVQTDLTGFRAIQIINNRFHSNRQGGVQNTGPNAHKITGIQCFGNHLDIGRTLWRGVLRRAVVYGNTINMTPTEAFYLTDGSGEYHIYGNQIAGDLNAERTPNNFYQLRGNHDNFVIENEIMSDCKEHAINIREGVVTNGVFRNITFIRPCSKIGSFCPITIVGENHSVDIDKITLVSDVDLTGLVRGTSVSSNIRVGKYKTVGNNTPKVVGSVMTQSDSLGDIGPDESNRYAIFNRPGAIVDGSLKSGAAGGMTGLTVSSAKSLNIESDEAEVRPVIDNTYSLGTALNRWAQVFAGTGAIQTSDARDKTEPVDIDDALLDAWEDVQLVAYQWLDSISTKGEDSARWHFGLIAQQVHAALSAHGIDGTRYGLLCHDVEPEQDEVLDEEGYVIQQYRPAGDRWGIRADQCLFVEAAYQRRALKKLEQRLSDISI